MLYTVCGRLLIVNSIWHQRFVAYRHLSVSFEYKLRSCQLKLCIYIAKLSLYEIKSRMHQSCGVQVPAWTILCCSDQQVRTPPFPIALVPNDKKPPRPMAESQTRPFMPFSMTDKLVPSSPYSNVSGLDAPPWSGPLPEHESHLERYWFNSFF